MKEVTVIEQIYDIALGMVLAINIVMGMVFASGTTQEQNIGLMAFVLGFCLVITRVERGF